MWVSLVSISWISKKVQLIYFRVICRYRSCIHHLSIDIGKIILIKCPKFCRPLLPADPPPPPPQPLPTQHGTMHYNCNKYFILCKTDNSSRLSSVALSNEVDKFLFRVHNSSCLACFGHHSSSSLTASQLMTFQNRCTYAALRFWCFT